MENNKLKILEFILDGLMNRYKKRVPDVERVIDILISNNIILNENEIENDHIAFRTIGIKKLGIESLEKIFLNLGYTKKDYFYFESKKLNAYWYSPPSNKFPRIFISELRVNELSKTAQDIIYKYTNNITKDPILEINLNKAEEIDEYLHKSLWQTPSWEDYEFLITESEYAAWTIYNKYYLNHYTISVHNLKKYNTLLEFNELLECNNILLNDSGGKIKYSPDNLLLQSSTIANIVKSLFADGSLHNIAGSYVEFAERKILPQYNHISKNDIKREHRREGFEAQNADKIFESTFTSQTNKR